MNAFESAHSELFGRVAERLAKTPTSTDHLMLTRWRVLSACQYMLGTPGAELEEACKSALETFALQGAGANADAALAVASGAIKGVEGRARSVLPSISSEKRLAVTKHLDELADSGASAIEQALRVLPSVRERLNSAADSVYLPGIRHRFGLAAAILQDAGRSERDRARAASGILYVNEVQDVVPDSLGLVGLLDDDYALRVVLSELGLDRNGSELHWSERISSLWDDLPFLQGVNLHRGDAPISVTWLDRLNSFVSYEHVLASKQAPLVLLQPAVTCSPLQPVVSLIGLLVLDAVTSTQSKAHELRIGQTYELDGFFVRFDGLARTPIEGWLRLGMREGVVHAPPAVADRMIPIASRRLSSQRGFSLRPRSPLADPMQRFFDWEDAIGAASISSRLVIVSSRQRATELLDAVQSNGVRLLEHGLVRFVDSAAENVETHGTLIFVVPTISTARLLLGKAVKVQAILVDGYERLYRGRHELPFLTQGQYAPPIVAWSATGYYPAASPSWLPPHTLLEVSSDDLVSVLALDDGADDASSCLWEAATGMRVEPRLVETPASERSIVEAIDEYLQAVRTSDAVPEYWRYQLTSAARTLRILVAATPAEWMEIKQFALAWSASVDEKWSCLRRTAQEALSAIRTAERRIVTEIAECSETMTSRAAGLLELFADVTTSSGPWYFVCDRREQVNAVTSLVRVLGLQDVQPALLRDVPVCSSCVVAGWVSASFARRLWAHTPRTVIALVDEDGRKRWGRAVEARRYPSGQPLLAAVGEAKTVSAAPGVSRSAHVPGTEEGERESVSESESESVDEEERTACVFVWVSGESEAKVLAVDSRVFVEEKDVASTRPAGRLRPDDRVIFGSGTSRWSPADEFTEALVDAVRKSHPEVVHAAKAWRQALSALQKAKGMSAAAVRGALAAAGVSREGQTVEGWLDVDRASPIAPRGLRAELAALWPLITDHVDRSLDDVVAACSRLRSFRGAASRALLQAWKGRPVDLGVDAARLDELVDRLRKEVHVYEVESVELGEVPVAMLGWWIPPALAERFHSDAGVQLPMAVEIEGEDAEA